MSVWPEETGYVAEISCLDGNGCEYPEPHDHGFACDKTCLCEGHGFPVSRHEAEAQRDESER